MSNHVLRLGLLGHNISYSFSPRIFEWAFSQTGLVGKYELLDLPPDLLPQLFRKLAMEYRGINVTIPYKRTAFEACTTMSDYAVTVQAVNTITFDENAIRGDNTDVTGFINALSQLLPKETAPNKVLVIGAGGAARAVIVGLATVQSIQSITVAIRDLSTARNRLKGFAAAPFYLCDSHEAESRMSEFDLIIQATPVGGKNVPGSPVSKEVKFRNGAAVMDLIYSPRETEFLERARDCGARTMNGLPMLIAQAGAAFDLWTSKKFPLYDALNVLPDLLYDL